MLVDAQSRKFLDEVRKGKPRKFVMICNGVKILNLIVYKRGSESRYKQQVKKADGSGQYFGGVVSGRGRNIVFELSSSEYDRTPGKDFFLKQFLEREAEILCKPIYRLVDRLTPVDESESASDEDRDDDESSGGQQMPDSETVTSPEGDPDASQLSPESAQTAVPPDSSSEADQEEQPAVLTKDERRKAKSERIAALLQESLEDLRPLFNQVIELHPGTEDDLVDAMSRIVDQIREEQFPKARQEISDLAHALNVLARQTPA